MGRLLTKIKGGWVEYDYSIDVPYMVVDKVLDGLSENGIEAEYLGKSKVVKIDGEVKQLNKKHIFFTFK